MKKVIVLLLICLTPFVVWATWDNLFRELHPQSTCHDLMRVLLCEGSYIEEANLSIRPLTLISSMYYIMLVGLGIGFVYASSMAYPSHYFGLVAIRYSSKKNYLWKTIQNNGKHAVWFCSMVALAYGICMVPFLARQESEQTHWNIGTAVLMYMGQWIKMVIFFHGMSMMGELLRHRFWEMSAVVLLVIFGIAVTVVDLLMKNNGIVTMDSDGTQIVMIGIMAFLDVGIIWLCQKGIWAEE